MWEILENFITTQKRISIFWIWNEWLKVWTTICDSNCYGRWWWWWMERFVFAVSSLTISHRRSFALCTHARLCVHGEWFCKENARARGHRWPCTAYTTMRGWLYEAQTSRSLGAFFQYYIFRVLHFWCMGCFLYVFLSYFSVHISLCLTHSSTPTILRFTILHWAYEVHRSECV